MITFPVYLISGKSNEVPLLLRTADWPVAAPIFSSLELAGALLVQLDFVENGEIWRVPNAGKLKDWLARVRDQCECVPLDLAMNAGRWRLSRVMDFEEFIGELEELAARELCAFEN